MGYSQKLRNIADVKGVARLSKTGKTVVLIIDDKLYFIPVKYLLNVIEGYNSTATIYKSKSKEK